MNMATVSRFISFLLFGLMVQSSVIQERQIAAQGKK